MKERIGRVTNSSSTNFIIGIKGEPSVDKVLEKNPFKYHTNFAVPTYVDNKTEFKLVSAHELARFLATEMSEAVVEQENNYRGHTPKLVTKEWLQKEVEGETYSKYSSNALIHIESFGVWIEKLCGKEIYSRWDAKAAKKIEEYFDVEMRPQGTQDYLHFDYAQMHDLHDKWLDKPWDDGNPQTRRQLITAIVNDWWEKHVGDGMYAYSLEYGNDGGNTGDLACFMDSNSMFTESYDIISFSHH